MAHPAIPVLAKVLGVGAVGAGGWWLWKGKHKHHAQSMKVGQDSAIVVPTTDDDPVLSQTDVPPTSDDISEVVTDDSDEVVGYNDTWEPDGYGGWRHHRYHRRYIPPPITPGLFPLAPTLVTPFGPTPLAIQSPYDVQRALNALGHGPLEVTGRIDPPTQAAIVDFQQKHGIAPTGVTRETTSHLQNAVQATLPKLSVPASGRTTPAAMPRTSAPAQTAVHAVATAPAPKTSSAPTPAPAAHSAHHGDCAIGAEPVVVHANPTTPAAVAKVISEHPITTPHAVQQALNKAGATPTLKVDGVIGPKTVAATKAFQIATGLVPDGVPGPKTRTALAIATCPPRKRHCLPCTCPDVGIPYFEDLGVIPYSDNEWFRRWGRTHHLRAVDPTRRGGAPITYVCPPPAKLYPGSMVSRNEQFLNWSATHHLMSMVDCDRYEFGAEFGSSGTSQLKKQGPRRSLYTAPMNATANRYGGNIPYSGISRRFG